ncbi:IS91 family transposase [Halioxenophilus aromaticivorans]|uniref:IS91 family transposase n=1 Tax=Halioxenophilus aromaticivorans TaxID=1306992 RepID=UPI0031E55572
MKTTVQQLIREYYSDSSASLPLSYDQRKALSSLSECRTAKLGGHAQYCQRGHLNGVWYNSCKHRACPQCRGIAREQWLHRMSEQLLSCSHHHVIFTLPDELNELWAYNRDVMSGILFDAVRETLKVFSSDPKYLNATPGILAVLHTWGRNLSLHPHLHVLLSHGGINSSGQWVEPKKAVLFPQKPVMQVYRGKLLANIRRAIETEMMVIPRDREKHHLMGLCNRLGRKDWVVYFAKRYDHARGVARYLARYIKGGPIRNQQLSQSEKDGLIRLRYYSHAQQRRAVMTLPASQFLVRFAQHVPVAGRPNLRYFGLYANSARKKLNQARRQLGQSALIELPTLKWQEYLGSKGWEPTCATCSMPLMHGGKIQRKDAA